LGVVENMGAAVGILLMCSLHSKVTYYCLSVFHPELGSSVFHFVSGGGTDSIHLTHKKDPELIALRDTRKRLTKFIHVQKSVRGEPGVRSERTSTSLDLHFFGHSRVTNTTGDKETDLTMNRRRSESI
jgi:hypothetical protein